MTSAAKELGMVRVLVLGVGPRCAEGTRSLEQGGPLPSRWCLQWPKADPCFTPSCLSPALI